MVKTYVFVVVLHILTDSVIDSTVLSFDPATMSVLEGNNAILTCYINNSDAGTYFISLNDQFIDVVQEHVNCTVTGALNYTREYNVRCINKGVEITIRNVTRDNHGEIWTCRRIMFKERYESYSTISVKVPITNVRFETQRENTKTKEYTGTNFVCVTSAGYPEATIRWYKNNKQLTNGDVSTSNTTTNKYLTVVKSTLTLYPTRADNSSHIYCEANNNGTTWPHSNRTSVIVYYPNYSWITPQGTIMTGRRLHITNISPTGGGSFTCKATNTMRLSSGQTHQGENTTTFKVLVLYPPSQPMFNYRTANGAKQLNMTKQYLHVVRNDSFTLTCTTDSLPPSTYRWTGHLNVLGTDISHLIS